MFYIENKNGIYPLNSCLRIDGYHNLVVGDIVIFHNVKKEAQDLIEKIQEAINNGESYYYINEV